MHDSMSGRLREDHSRDSVHRKNRSLPRAGAAKGARQGDKLLTDAGKRRSASPGDGDLDRRDGFDEFARLDPVSLERPRAVGQIGQHCDASAGRHQAAGCLDRLGADGDRRTDAGESARLFRRLGKLVHVQKHERVGLELTDRNAFGLGQRVPSGQPDTVAGRLDAFNLQHGRVPFPAADDDCDVEFAVDQQMLQIAAAVLDDLHADRGEGAAEARENFGENISRHQRGHAERELAGGGRLVAPERPPRLRDIGEDFSGMAEELVALERQVDPLRLSLEQRSRDRPRVPGSPPPPSIPYVELVAYGRSKTANILLAVEFDRRHKAQGIRATAVHPGGIQTELGRYMTPEVRQQLIDRINAANAAAGAPAFSWKTIPQGAATSVWAGVVAKAEEVGGRYCEDCHVADLTDDPEARSGVRAYALNPERARVLWARSEALVGELFP